VGVQVVPVFISVDPERDSPERIKEYVQVGDIFGLYSPFEMYCTNVCSVHSRDLP
jgi:hypothetical protein